MSHIQSVSVPLFMRNISSVLENEEREATVEIAEPLHTPSCCFPSVLTGLLLRDTRPHPDHLTYQGYHNGKQSQMHLGCWQAPASVPGYGHLQGLQGCQM